MVRVFFPAAFAVLIALAQPVPAEPVRILDSRGRTVELPAPAERIISVPIPLASVIMALDRGPDRLIGIHPSARQSIAEGFLRKVFPRALDIPTDVVRGGQFNPNLESILGRRPDLVVQWSEPPQLLEGLEAAGLPVIGLSNDPESQELNERNLRAIATAIGRTDRLRHVLDMNERIRASIDEELQGLAPEARPRVLYFREYGAVNRPSGSNTYRDFQIALTGGVNAAAALRGTNAAINLEQIIAWNPQVIFLGAFDAVPPAAVLATPELAGVEAVRNRRVYKVPHGGYRWDPGSHESALAWLWLAQLLQPDRFRANLRAEMRAAYDFFYAYRLTDDEIDAILRFDVNAGMAGYDRFKR